LFSPTGDFGDTYDDWLYPRVCRGYFRSDTPGEAVVDLKLAYMAPAGNKPGLEGWDGRSAAMAYEDFTREPHREVGFRDPWDRNTAIEELKRLISPWKMARDRDDNWKFLLYRARRRIQAVWQVKDYRYPQELVQMQEWEQDFVLRKTVDPAVDKDTFLPKR